VTATEILLVTATEILLVTATEILLVTAKEILLVTAKEILLVTAPPLNRTNSSFATIRACAFIAFIGGIFLLAGGCTH
jgi:hypothetical protein